MLYVVFVRENGRLVSLTLTNEKEYSRDHAELFSLDKAKELAKSRSAEIMSEDDWFSY